MQITVSASSWACRWIEGGSITLELPPGAAVADALALCGIPDGEIGLITCCGTLAERDSQLSDGDKLLVLPVIVGG